MGDFPKVEKITWSVVTPFGRSYSSYGVCCDTFEAAAEAALKMENGRVERRVTISLQEHPAESHWYAPYVEVIEASEVFSPSGKKIEGRPTVSFRRFIAPEGHTACGWCGALDAIDDGWHCTCCGGT